MIHPEDVEDALFEISMTWGKVWGGGPPFWRDAFRAPEIQFSDGVMSYDRDALEQVTEIVRHAIKSWQDLWRDSPEQVAIYLAAIVYTIKAIDPEQFCARSLDERRSFFRAVLHYTVTRVETSSETRQFLKNVMSDARAALKSFDSTRDRAFDFGRMPPLYDRRFGISSIAFFEKHYILHRTSGLKAVDVLKHDPRLYRNLCTHCSRRKKGIDWLFQINTSIGRSNRDNTLGRRLAGPKKK